MHARFVPPPTPQLAPLVLASLFQQPPMDRLPDVGAAFAGGEATNLNLNFTSDDSHSACSCTLKEMVSRYLTLHCNLTFEYLLIYFAYFRLAIHLHLVILTSIKSTWLFSQFLSVYFSVSISFSESLCGWGGFMFCGCLFGQPWR